MVIILPILVMLLTAVILILLRYLWSKYKYPWIFALGGMTLALIGIFLWQFQLPQTISLPPWQPVTLFYFSSTWLVDGNSWPYAVSLAALATAIIWTSVVRQEKDPVAWAGTILLSALGILAVTAENPLTLILIWTAIDLVELFTMLQSTEGEEQNQGVLIAFSARVAGTFVVIWANLISSANGIFINFQATPASAGIYMMIATGLRLGVLPLHLPYRKENVLRRGFGTSLRLVSAAASLGLLARIPASALKSPMITYLLIMTAITSLYAGWMWLRSSDEILGRPFWVLGIGSLSITTCILGNPIGGIGWGVMLILGGGLLFLFSARQRKILWIPLLGLWGLSSLPYSVSATAWQTGNEFSWLPILPFLPAQGLLMAGFIRHTLHPGETSLESHERWTKVIYPTGLFLLAAISILLGLWGWKGAENIGNWWVAITSNVLAAGFTALVLKGSIKLVPASISNQWMQLFRLEKAYQAVTAIYDFLRRIADSISASLEGEGGLLWSLLLLTLILSILSILIKPGS
jgi:hypothetical protein